MRTCILKASPSLSSATSNGGASASSPHLASSSTSTSDQLRFEVHSTPSRGHQSIQKWYMKANHPVEASRWVQAIRRNVEWYRREGQGAAGAPETEPRRASGDSDQSGVAMSVHQSPNPNQTQTVGRRQGPTTASGRPTTSSGIAPSNGANKASTVSAKHKSAASMSTGTSR